MAVSWGEGLCCAIMACNVVVLICASVLFSEGGGGDNVFDENLWTQDTSEITVQVQGGVDTPPPVMEMKVSKTSKAD